MKKPDFNNKNKSIYIYKILANINWEKYFGTKFETSFSTFSTKFINTFKNCFPEKKNCKHWI